MDARYFDSIDRFINNNHVTHSNMEELITDLRKRHNLDRICTENHLNPILIKEILSKLMRGRNHAEIAQDLKVHRITVQRYIAILKNINYEDLNALWDYALSDKREELI